MRARGDRGGEDIAHLHLTHHEADGFGHALAAQLVAVELKDAATQIDHLRLVVEHLFEGRLQPAFVQAVAEEAAADMVIGAAEQDAVQGGEDDLAELGRAGAQEGAPHHFDQQRVEELGHPDHAAEEKVIALGDAQRRQVQVHAFLAGGHVAVVEGLDCGLDLAGGVVGAGAVILPELDAIADHMPEAGIVGLVRRRLIAGHPPGQAFGRQEDVERPAARMLHDAGSALVEHV